MRAPSRELRQYLPGTHARGRRKRRADRAAQRAEIHTSASISGPPCNVLRWAYRSFVADAPSLIRPAEHVARAVARPRCGARRRPRPSVAAHLLGGRYAPRAQPTARIAPSADLRATAPAVLTQDARSAPQRHAAGARRQRQQQQRRRRRKAPAGLAHGCGHCERARRKGPSARLAERHRQLRTQSRPRARAAGGRPGIGRGRAARRRRRSVGQGNDDGACALASPRPRSPAAARR
jgi:hypothetical protein